MVVEQKREIANKLLGERKDVAVVQEKDNINIFCTSRVFYEEISEPFEKYGFKVYCGRKPRMSF